VKLSDYKKLIEEFPESEKDVKSSYGYQIAVLQDQLDNIYCEILKEISIHKFYLALSETFSIKGKIKRYLQICFNPKYWSKPRQ
jgi:hypothetical protein